MSKPIETDRNAAPHLDGNFQTTGVTVNATNLVVGFNGRTVLNLDHISASAGRVTVIMGKSGCGKTTLLDTLNGLKKRTSGKLVFRIDDTKTEKSPLHRIGRTYQGFPMLPWVRVKEHFWLRQRIIGARFDKTEGLRLVGASHLENRYPVSLSGGERARCAIALAVSGDVKILLLDEPLNGLDYWRKQEIMSVIRRLTVERAIATVIVTHDLGDATEVADDLLVLGGSPARVTWRTSRSEFGNFDLSKLRKALDPCVD